MMSSLQTNVPNIRLAYRHQTLVGELDMIRGRSSASVMTSIKSSPAPREIILPTADVVAAKTMADTSINSKAV